MHPGIGRVEAALNVDDIAVAVGGDPSQVATVVIAESVHSGSYLQSPGRLTSRAQHKLSANPMPCIPPSSSNSHSHAAKGTSAMDIWPVSLPEQIPGLGPLASNLTPPIPITEGD